MKRNLLSFFVVFPLCVPFAVFGEVLPALKTKEFTIQGKYINFPFGQNAFGTWMHIFVDGEPIGRFNVDLQEENPCFHGFIDVERFKGRTVKIVVDSCPTDLSRITNDDVIAGNENLYGEVYRPQYHFTSKRGWFNDPNGLIYYKGKYHMYYQHNPMSVFWGNIRWGHAESDDLIHWKEKPHVLFPLAETGECFTGACFIDKKDQLGLGKGVEDVIIAYYLRTNSGLSYAYSLDGGETFADYEGNPIVAKSVGRERIDSPKPMFHEPSQRWVAPVFDDRFLPAENRNSMTVSIYSSADLKTWVKESDIGEVDLNAECPDLFPLPLDGDPDNQRWVLVLGNASYVIGQFDGKQMYCDASGAPATYKDFMATIPAQGHYYASMTWDNIPADDGRRIQIAWMKNVFNDSTIFRGMPFNQQMSLPMELTLRSTADGPRVFMNPVVEVKALRAESVVSRRNFRLRQEDNPLDGVQGEQVEICFKAKVKAASRFAFNLRGTDISYDASINKLSVKGVEATLTPENGMIDLRIFVDTRSVEVVANGGRLFIPLLQEFEDCGYSLLSAGSDTRIGELTVYPLKSVWHE